MVGDAVFDYVILGELRNASRHVWLPLPGPDGGPVRLAGLEQALPDPWQDYREQRARERRQAADRQQALRDAGPDDEPGTAGEAFR